MFDVEYDTEREAGGARPGPGRTLRLEAWPEVRGRSVILRLPVRAEQVTISRETDVREEVIIGASVWHRSCGALQDARTQSFTEPRADTRRNSPTAG